MHTHNWSKVGIWETKDKAIYPCLDSACPAALLKTPGQDISTGEVLDNRLAEIVTAFDGLCFEDDPAGSVAKVIMTEVIETYKFHKMKLKPGDVVIDIGAHVGVVSIFLAKRYGVIVYAYEPVWENYSRLIHNVYNNGVSDRVYSVNKAVTGDGRRVTLNVDPKSNSAGASSWTSGSGKTETRESVTLAGIFGGSELDHCRLLKIDSEGSEYETLLNTPPDVLSQIDYLCGEFHTNKRLRKAGYKPAALRKWLRQWIKSVRADTCKMAE